MTEKWLCKNTVISILDYVEYFSHKFTRECEIEHDNLKQNQAKMKQCYAKDVKKEKTNMSGDNTGLLERI